MLLGKQMLKLPNGDVYIGDIDHLSYIPKSWGTRTGKGVHFFVNGDIYEGSFVDGVPHGKGTFRYSNGNNYKGYFETGKCHGRGLLKYPDNNILEGQWSDGKLSEKVKIRMFNGDVFTGIWRESCKISKGTYTFSNGDSLEGEFRAGAYKGFGKYFTKTGIYEGMFISSAAIVSGCAKLELTDGSYSGEIEIVAQTGHELVKLFGNDHCYIVLAILTGKATLVYKDGSQYSGSFVNGKYHGTGIRSFRNGAYYDGDWKDGLRHGTGKNKFCDGLIYKGFWKDDKWNGRGSLFYPDGSICIAKFEDDKVIKVICMSKWDNENGQNDNTSLNLISYHDFENFSGLRCSEN